MNTKFLKLVHASGLAAAIMCCAVLHADAAPVVQVQKARHVSIFTRDNEKVAQWYVDMLGMQNDARFSIKRPDGSSVDIIRLKLGDFLMHVSTLDKLTAKERQLEYAGWRHVAFIVDDVDKVWADLKAKGADIVGRGGMDFNPQGASLPAYRVAFVRDPDGNFVELYQERIK
jgi:catechol 2,3-dioxygenase-like lactoylglutathione lyase family enzyme